MRGVATAFPRAQLADTFFYRKGIALAGVGRVDDAKKMLAEGDANLTVGVDGSKTEVGSNRSDRRQSASTDAGGPQGVGRRDRDRREGARRRTDEPVTCAASGVRRADSRATSTA